MSTSTTATPAPSFLSDIENFFSFVGNSIETWLASATGQTVTTTIATFAGSAAGYELINNVKSTSKQSVAQDVVNIGVAALVEISGTTPPTLTQLQTVFAGLKSNESTDLFIPLAQAAASAIASFIGTNDGGQTGTGKWQPVAAAFINGLIAVAEGFGATAPVATPTSAS